MFLVFQHHIPSPRRPSKGGSDPGLCPSSIGSQITSPDLKPSGGPLGSLHVEPDCFLFAAPVMPCSVVNSSLKLTWWAILLYCGDKTLACVPATLAHLIRSQPEALSAASMVDLKTFLCAGSYVKQSVDFAEWPEKPLHSTSVDSEPSSLSSSIAPPGPGNWTALLPFPPSELSGLQGAQTLKRMMIAPHVASKKLS